MSDWTLGQLAAAELGSVVTFRDGGATYRGTLKQVQHGLSLRDEAQTLVIITEGEWRHIKTHPAQTPCALEVGA